MSSNDYIYGGAAFVLVVLALAATLVGEGSLQSKIAVWVIALGALAVWAWLRVGKWRASRRLKDNTLFVTKHGIRVMDTSYAVSQGYLEQLVDQYIHANVASLGFEKLTLVDAQNYPRVFIGIKLTFTTLPFSHSSRPDYPKLAGLSNLKDRWMIVGWQEELERTALIHELDHFVRGPCTHPDALLCTGEDSVV